MEWLAKIDDTLFKAILITMVVASFIPIVVALYKQYKRNKRRGF